MKESHYERFREDLREFHEMTGKAEGKAEYVLQLLAVKGPVSSELKQIICGQRDVDILNNWHLLAAGAESVEAFVKETGIGIS